jgi:hypothetical protein
MAAKNIPENKRFVFRSSDKKFQTYLVTKNQSRSHIPSKDVQLQTGLATEVVPSSHAEETPARRVVVIRSTKHPQVKQGPLDLGDFGHPNSTKIPPVINNGVRVLLIYFGSLVMYISAIILAKIGLFHSTTYCTIGTIRIG